MYNNLVLFLLVNIANNALCLKCYTCSVGEQDIDRSCIDDPGKSSTVTNCNKRFCTIQRQEFKDPKNKVASIFRGCEDDPLYMNQIIEDETYRIYYTACQTELCNGGTGKSSDSNGDAGSLGDKSTLLVPGTGAAAPSTICALSTLVLLAIAHLIM